MNYFELYPGDYLRDTAELSIAEHGAFLKLMLTYYAKEQPLPGEYARLYMIAVAMSPAEKAAVRKVADEFFPVAEDGLRHNARMDAEIVKAQGRIDAARTNGRRGGRPKKNPAGFEGETQEKPSGLPVGSPEETQKKAHQTPDPSRSKSSPPERSPVAPASAREGPPPETRAPLPPEVDPNAWAAFEDHHREKRKWSIARQRLAVSQLDALIAEGIDPTPVLTWATVRGLADLADAARRMAADAAKETEHANRPRPGESRTAHAERINRELDERERRAAGG